MHGVMGTIINLHNSNIYRILMDKSKQFIRAEAEQLKRPVYDPESGEGEPRTLPPGLEVIVLNPIIRHYGITTTVVSSKWFPVRSRRYYTLERVVTPSGAVIHLPATDLALANGLADEVHVAVGRLAAIMATR